MILEFSDLVVAINLLSEVGQAVLTVGFGLARGQAAGVWPAKLIKPVGARVALGFGGDQQPPRLVVSVFPIAEKRWQVQQERIVSNRSSNAFPIAVSTTSLSALSAWLAAPEPRPPHPISPTRNFPPFSLPHNSPGRIAGAANAPPTKAVLLRNSRRLISRCNGLFILDKVVASIEQPKKRPEITPASREFKSLLWHNPQEQVASPDRQARRIGGSNRGPHRVV